MISQYECPSKHYDAGLIIIMPALLAQYGLPVSCHGGPIEKYHVLGWAGSVPLLSKVVYLFELM